MATKRMLIDASHPEETRVVIVNGNRLEDFDVEVESRKQLKGNIYLAKVTRVEPSLQAAFVDYGGNRHGFLAFSEIHPDYYQIPVADREALLAEDQAEESENGDDEADSEEDAVETLGGDDSEEVESRRPHHMRRNYKIQEVIKRRQVLLIQVVKEERGGKGAALTTYLSLAGRYCVLMPNTARGGGISRKISNGADRKRLKSIVNDLGIPQGVAVIVRTAGAKRSKAEINRDYEYMTRLWSKVRETTLESTAPNVVHEEGDLIKRSIRDLYDKEIEEVIVAGEDGYRVAKDFMKLLIPSHAKKVQRYTEDTIPLMQHYQVEDQLGVIHSQNVHLKSGGYIVINPTEALVSIDVNSGKATKERNIEETALKTNMEAAEEIARQLKLRDLAGLIVIDFIDMEVSRNQSKVERQIKDAMRTDRARIQIGRISPFGLLELSRQRLRPSLIETSSEPCPHCEGTGVRRSTDSTALHMLRAIEEECMSKTASSHTIYVPTAVALYLLNHKRPALADIEARYQTVIYLENDDTLIPPAHRTESSEDVKQNTPRPASRPASNDDSSEQDNSEDGSKRRRRRRRGKRKNNDADSNQENQTEEVDNTEAAANGSESQEANKTDSDDEQPNKTRRRGRRGGRRRGKKTEEITAEATAEDASSTEPQLLVAPEEKELLMPPSSDADEAIALPDESAKAEEAPKEEKPKRGRRRKAKTDDSDAPKAEAKSKKAKDSDAAAPEAETPEAAEEKKKPVRRRRRRTAETKVGKTEAEEVKTDNKAEEPTKVEAETATAVVEPEAPAPEEAKPVAAGEPEEPIVAIVAEESSPAPVEISAEDEQAVREAAKTTIINIGDAAAEPEAAPARKGWWRR